jgi:hypothetical protein
VGWTKTNKDRNQDPIRADLELVGAVTFSLAGVGEGCGDILVAYSCRNWLFEIKNPKASKSRRELRPKQKAFRDKWKRCGQYAKIEHAEEAMEIMGVPRETITRYLELKRCREADERKIKAGAR